MMRKSDSKLGCKCLNVEEKEIYTRWLMEKGLARNILLPCLYNIPISRLWNVLEAHLLSIWVSKPEPRYLYTRRCHVVNLSKETIQRHAIQRHAIQRPSLMPVCMHRCWSASNTFAQKGYPNPYPCPYPSKTNKRDADVDTMLTKSKSTPQPHPYHTSSTPSHPAQSSTANHRLSEYKSVWHSHPPRLYSPLTPSSPSSQSESNSSFPALT